MWEEAKIWIQDNLRIIISILIVIAIGGGIYSYSKQNPSKKQKPTNNSAFEDKSSSFEDSSSKLSETELDEVRKILCK